LSESNLSKKDLKKRVVATYTISRQKCVFDPLLHEEEEKAQNTFQTLSCKKTMHLTIPNHEKLFSFKGFGISPWWKTVYLAFSN